MAENTKIEWAHHTFNPWIGCTKVSAGCANCYAETLMDKRWQKVKWGPSGTRVRTGAANWRKPRQWNEEAAAAGERWRIFCASLADVLEDRDELAPWRKELQQLTLQTPHLDWMLLTKRPENAHLWPGPTNQRNLWWGVSMENQRETDERMPHLLRIDAGVRFISAEPLLEKVGFGLKAIWCRHHQRVEPTLEMDESIPCFRAQALVGDMIDMIILGGESGPGARPCHADWIAWARDQAEHVGVAPFVKQGGSNFHMGGHRIRLKHPKGGDLDELHPALRVRRLPTLKNLPKGTT